MAIVGLEWIIVGIIILALFFGGGKKISEFAKGLGRATGEFQKGRTEVEQEIEATKKALKVSK